jgi:hypothetical protein
MIVMNTYVSSLNQVNQIDIKVKISDPKELGEGDQTDAKARSSDFPIITEESRMKIQTD